MSLLADRVEPQSLCHAQRVGGIDGCHLAQGAEQSPQHGRRGAKRLQRRMHRHNRALLVSRYAVHMEKLARRCGERLRLAQRAAQRGGLAANLTDVDGWHQAALILASSRAFTAGHSSSMMLY